MVQLVRKNICNFVCFVPTVESEPLKFVPACRIMRAIMQTIYCILWLQTVEVRIIMFKYVEIKKQRKDVS